MAIRRPAVWLFAKHFPKALPNLSTREKPTASGRSQLLIATHANCEVRPARKGNAPQEVLLLRGWLKFSACAKTSRKKLVFLLFCLLLRCHEGSSLNDFRCKGSELQGPQMQNATQLMVPAAPLAQDIEAVLT